MFSKFFQDKVINIRTELESERTPEPLQPHSFDVQFTQTPVLKFLPVTEESVKSILKQCSPRSCELDPVPICLSLYCTDAVILNITTIINDSLQSGVSQHSSQLL